jgi:hypothetical protein
MSGIQTRATNSHGKVAVAPKNAGLERGRPRPRLLLVIGCLLFALSACTSTPKPMAYEPLVVRFFIEARPGEAGVLVHLPVSGVSVTVAAKPVLVEYDILNAEVAKVELGQCLLLQFTPAAARDLYRLSVASMGRRLVLTLNDEPVGARPIDQAMPDGTLVVFVERPDSALPALVERIKRTSDDIVAAAKKK